MSPPKAGKCDALQINYSSMFEDRIWIGIATSLSLTNRQMQIVQGVFDDATEYAIAHDLGISQHTVRTHMVRIYQKLGVSSRAMLVLRVVSESIRLLGHGRVDEKPISIEGKS